MQDHPSDQEALNIKQKTMQIVFEFLFSCYNSKQRGVDFSGEYTYSVHGLQCICHCYEQLVSGLTEQQLVWMHQVFYAQTWRTRY